MDLFKQVIEIVKVHDEQYLKKLDAGKKEDTDVERLLRLQALAKKV
jgi:hypothetical protein